MKLLSKTTDYDEIATFGKRRKIKIGKNNKTPKINL